MEDFSIALRRRPLWRPLRGLAIVVAFDPGVPLRFTPGSMLTPAPQAGPYFNQL
jgi:hypothetical protein